MKIVSLTTDMGLKDHYVASVKARLLSQFSEIQIIDITHQIEAFNISQAAFCLNNCIDDFPKDTIHIVAIDSEPVINYGSPQHNALPGILKYKNQYIISNDNGFFSLLVKEDTFEDFWIAENNVTNDDFFKFPVKHIFVPLAIKLLQGEKIENFASKKESFKRMIAVNPVIEKNLIRGIAAHIDHFGNIITNIDKETFYRIGNNAPFTIFFRKKDYYIDVISNAYGDVVSGEKVAFFNSNDLLEIAINKGSRDKSNGASHLFGIENGDTIRIEFTPDGSKNSIQDLF